MDHGEEQAIWRAIGACEGDLNAVDDELNRMQDQIASIRLRDRLAFVLVLIAGLLIGAWVASEGSAVAVAEAHDRRNATYVCPGPPGVDPRPQGACDGTR